MKPSRLWIYLCLIVVLVILAGAEAPCAYDSGDLERIKTFEVFGGTAFNFRLPTKIEQSGQPDLDFDAKYQTRPFEEALYYSIRFGRWRNGRATEIEWLHHKLYMVDKPAEVQKFDISHGFNMVFLNRAKEKNGVIYRVGGGPVITHPENTVRGLSLPEDGGIFDKGYYLSGAAVQLACGKRFDFSERWYGALEAKATFAYARVKVEDGHANVGNIAAHILFGIGYRY